MSKVSTSSAAPSSPRPERGRRRTARAWAATAQVSVHLVGRQTDPESPALADLGGCAEHLAEQAVAECDHTARVALGDCPLDEEALVDGQRGQPALLAQCDRSVVDPEQLSQEIRQLPQRPAEGAGECGDQGVRLALGSGVVDDHDDALARLVAAEADVLGHAHRPQTADVDAVDRPLVDVPREDPGALAVVGVVACPARADRAAVAGLEERTAELIWRVAHERLRSVRFRWSHADPIHVSTRDTSTSYPCPRPSGARGPGFPVCTYEKRPLIVLRPRRSTSMPWSASPTRNRPLAPTSACAPRTSLSSAVVQRDGATGRALPSRPLDADVVADGECGEPALAPQVDRRSLHGEQFAEDVGQLLQRAAEPSAERRGHRVRLLARGALVDEDHDTLFGLVARAEVLRHAHGPQARHVDLVDRPLLDLPGEHPRALAFVGVTTEPARTDHVAVARLVERPVELVGRRPPVSRRPLLDRMTQGRARAVVVRLRVGARA